MTVDKQSGNLLPPVLHKGRFLTVGELQNLSRLGAGKDIVSVGGQSGNALVEEVSLALQREVGHVDTVYTLVGANPDVVVVAFYHAGNGQLTRHDELLFQTETV